MILFTHIFLQAQPAQSGNALSIGDIITIIAIAISFLTGIAALAYKSGYLVRTLNHIEADLKSIKHDVKYVPALIERVNILWRAKVSVNKSPIVLNEYGQQLLTSSKISDLTDKYYSEILEQVKSKKPENAYQAQEGLIGVVASYKDLEKCKQDLEQAAFVSGSDIDTLLLVAAINIRDRVIKELNLNPADIDKYDPKKQNKPA